MSKNKKSNKRSQPRRHFEPSFKLEAVALAHEIGFRQASSDLGVTDSNLRNWSKLVDQRGQAAFSSVSERTDSDAELKRLRAENRILRMERDILKKATVYFAKENG